jgi:hypothetical protein
MVPRVSLLFIVTGLALSVAPEAFAGFYGGNPITLFADGAIDSAVGDLTSVTFTGCGRTATWTEVRNEQVNLADEGISLDLPAGEYCKCTVEFDGELTFEGDGGSWEHTLFDETFVLDVNSQETAFELPLAEITETNVTLTAH